MILKVIFLSILLPLLLLFLYLFISNAINLIRGYKVLKLIRESIRLSSQIVAWLKEHIKDGVPVSVLNDPELLSLIKKDQDLYDKICKLDSDWKNITMPPVEIHKHLLELARGKHRTTH